MNIVVRWLRIAWLHIRLCALGEAMFKLDMDRKRYFVDWQDAEVQRRDTMRAFLDFSATLPEKEEALSLKIDAAWDEIARLKGHTVVHKLT